MAAPTKRPKSHWDDTVEVDDNTPSASFDVVCTIGTVVLGGVHDLTASEAAFLLIARHNTPGVFTFPHPDGETTRIEVSFEAR